jgi:hypothetical protein
LLHVYKPQATDSLYKRLGFNVPLEKLVSGQRRAGAFESMFWQLLRSTLNVVRPELPSRPPAPH